MSDLIIFIPLFTLGLVSSAHCIGMCGGIMGALSMAIPAEAKAKRIKILISYNLGRILSYTLMGLVAGFFAKQFAGLGGGPLLRIVAGVLLIAMGLYLADWWRGLTKLENLGRYLWVYIQPLGKGLMPVDKISKALLLGALWGWLPCGLVYAALAMAMTQPAPGLAAGAMLAFGLGTLPAVLAAGLIAQQLVRALQQRQVRVVLALMVILFGVWTIWGSLGHGHHNSSHDSSADHTHMHHSDMHSSVHSAMNHEHQAPSATLERQRTDSETKLEDDNKSSSSSVEAGHDHHH
jgi:sulfite exporter TauE/SafE